MAPKIVTRTLLTIGFLAASVAYGSWTAQRTIFDPGATRGATTALLSTPTVHDLLAREIRAALQPRLGPHVNRAKLNAAINTAVSDPRFIGAFEDAIVKVDTAVVSGGDGRVTLDTNAVTTAVNDAVTRTYPKIAPQVKHTKVLSVPIGSADLPHLGNAKRTVREVGDLALAIAILLIGGAVALAPEPATFRRTGRRVAFLAVTPVVVFAVGPRLLAASHNGALSVSAAILDAYGHRVLFSAALLGAAGVIIWILAVAIPKRRRRPDGPVPSPRPVRARPSAPRVPAAEPGGLPDKLYL
ncbi:MAG TPA: hypothetical protein VK771_00160 [Acidimicrobiia bacterium]|nr:hypothetical protein [Acidimicrobiia bacterium]